MQVILSSTILTFELKNYGPESLVYKTVLEFFTESGGVY
jgi:hypothetical protein